MMLLKNPYLSRIHTEIFVGETIQHLALKTLQLKIQRGKKSVMGVKKAGRKEGGREGGEREKRSAVYRTQDNASCVRVCVLPGWACSRECSGSLGHSACCGKGQGHRVSNIPWDAERLPRSLSGCGPSGACWGPAGRLEGEVGRSKRHGWKRMLRTSARKRWWTWVPSGRPTPPRPATSGPSYRGFQWSWCNCCWCWEHPVSAEVLGSRSYGASSLARRGIAVPFGPLGSRFSVFRCTPARDNAALCTLPSSRCGQSLVGRKGESVKLLHTQRHRGHPLFCLSAQHPHVLPQLHRCLFGGTSLSWYYPMALCRELFTLSRVEPTFMNPGELCWLHWKEVTFC